MFSTNIFQLTPFRDTVWIFRRIKLYSLACRKRESAHITLIAYFRTSRIYATTVCCLRVGKERCRRHKQDTSALYNQLEDRRTKIIIGLFVFAMKFHSKRELLQYILRRDVCTRHNSEKFEINIFEVILSYSDTVAVERSSRNSN